MSKKQGTSIPEDWEPSAELVAWVRKTYTIADWQLDDTVEDFRDYWLATPGARGRKLDWNATFRNWVRRSFQRFRRRPGDYTSKTGVVL